VPLLPGETFDRYVIEELLGEGGMGEVYRAVDGRLHRKVALKLLRNAGAIAGTDDGSKGAARMLREARAAAALDHPNAVSIFDVGEHDGAPYIAMELVRGSTLRSYVGNESVSMTRRVRWLTDIARALGAAHKRGLVHRDIKPENVMVRDDDAIKVLDFGIARQSTTRLDPTGATEPAGIATITGEGAIVGTPLYMAPEQMRGEKLDGRADQFSWGVVAYEVLTGRVPWHGGNSSYKVLAQILTQDVDPPSRIAPDVPPEVDAVVTRALAKKPDDRFASMEEIVLWLDPKPASGRGSIPRPPGSSRATPAASTVTHMPTGGEARPRRGRLALALSGVTVALAVAIGVVATRRPATTTAPPKAPSPPDSASVADHFTLLNPPITGSTDPVARRAYGDALQAAHRGDFDRTIVKATAADPNMLEARVRLSVYA
jgi:serine/threonine protein kinase